MTRIRSLRRSDAQLLADLSDILRPRRPRRLPGIAWRWRYELALAAGLACLITALVRAFGTEGATVCLSAAVGAAGPWPPTHRAFAAWMWRLVTPHRLRTGFAMARIESRQGRLPAILLTSRQPFGERVRVWCPAGTSAEDLRAARSILRAACWAAEVRVAADARHPQIVTVDVIRRGPAAAAGRRGRAT